MRLTVRASKDSTKVVQGFDGPSFDCSRASGGARKMICDTPDLAATDMKNHEHYIALLQRGRIDASLMDKQNEQFLALRDKCSSIACIRAAYGERNKLLDALEVTMNAPPDRSGAAFTATDAAWAKARAKLGKPCGDAPAKPFPGFTRIPGFRTLNLLQSWVGGFTTPGGRFAFLNEVGGRRLRQLPSKGRDCGACVGHRLPGAGVQPRFRR